MKLEYKYIENDESLLEICDQFRGSEWLAIDTEFEREKTYYPELCLVQVANAELVAVIDPLVIGNLQPLFDLLYDSSIIKVFHAARQDLEIFYMLQGAIPQPLFDTQIAAPLVGYDEQMGYARLVNLLLGVELSKAHTRTDWKRRPLQQAQLQYAADDAIYLGQIYNSLINMLAEHDRVSWLEEDFSALCDPDLYEPDPEKAWRKIRSAKKLKGKKLSALQHLAAWRERKARSENRPRNWVLKDDAITDIAQLQPTTKTDLERLKSLKDQFIKKYAGEILQIINVAEQQEPASFKQQSSRKPLNLQEEVKVDALTTIVRLIANANNLHPNILASRKELESFVKNENDSSLLKGWREQLIGNPLKEFLAGKISLQIIDNEMICKQV